MKNERVTLREWKLTGGGTDLTASAGQVHKGETVPRQLDEKELEAEPKA